MKQVAKFTLATIGILSVAGCMGSNSGATGAGAGGGGDFANKAALEELQARTVFQSTPIAALPTSSTASYTGFVQLAEGATDIVAIQGAEVVGTATFEVGFAGSGSFTGSATNFQDALGD